MLQISNQIIVDLLKRGVGSMTVIWKRIQANQDTTVDLAVIATTAGTAIAGYMWLAVNFVSVLR